MLLLMSRAGWRMMSRVSGQMKPRGTCVERGGGGGVGVSGCVAVVLVHT